MDPLKLALICGGPSGERGISLNSARSVSDHLPHERYALSVFYVDEGKAWHELDRSHLYSNAPGDFDFKLDSIAERIDGLALTRRLLEEDLAFPVIHGHYGEDGQLQEFLDDVGLPFVGPDAHACKAAFDKHDAAWALSHAGFATLPHALITADGDALAQARAFFSEHGLERAIVKPARGGSSIGVKLCASPEEAASWARDLIRDLDSRVIVEPFCDGIEFTLLVLQNDTGEPVSLIPTEIELLRKRDALFDYRAKYLASAATRYHSPPRFGESSTARIRQEAEQVFRLLGMRDFCRMDGWLLEDGRVWFSDINPISGMEQNSFLFLQGAQIGLSHQDLLEHLVDHAAARSDLRVPPRLPRTGIDQRLPVSVLYGGVSAERQVSVLSGTNVWLKLRNSERYAPRPFFLASEKTVYELPYHYNLYHTAEEILDLCKRSKKLEAQLYPYRDEIQERLLNDPSRASLHTFVPEKTTLDRFVDSAACVFIALHGGIGESGVLQQKLEKAGTTFTGSDAEASALCMDKVDTGTIVKRLQDAAIETARRITVSTSEAAPGRALKLWDSLRQGLAIGAADPVIVKPRGDGCSAGVARLANPDDLAIYLTHLKKKSPLIEAGTLNGDPRLIEMPPQLPAHLIFEEYVATDRVEVRDGKLAVQRESGWIEVTVGVLGKKDQMRALNPSVTVVDQGVLSLEEKFQGGTGINITPPPKELVSPAALRNVRIGNHQGRQRPRHARLRPHRRLHEPQLRRVDHHRSQRHPRPHPFHGALPPGARGRSPTLPARSARIDPGRVPQPRLTT